MKAKQITALVMAAACFIAFLGCSSNVAFSETIKESDGQIYVDNRELSIYINIERESTDYWELKIASGSDVFKLLEDNPPGKVAQDGHSWILEAVKPGKSVMEFTLYDENNKEKGAGYRFTFNVDDNLKITGGADVYDLSDINYGAFAQETADRICESLNMPKGEAHLITEGDDAGIVIDGDVMTVYGIAYEFDVGAYLAFDAVLADVYFCPHANGEYYEVIFDGDGGCELGQQAAVIKPLDAEIEIGEAPWQGSYRNSDETKSLAITDFDGESFRFRLTGGGVSLDGTAAVEGYAGNYMDLVFAMGVQGRDVTVWIEKPLDGSHEREAFTDTYFRTEETGEYIIPEITPVVQEYDGDNIAEILSMSYGGENAGIEQINASILGGVLEIYNQFTENRDEYSWIEIKSYPFSSEDYVQIVTTCADYPSYGTDGEIWSYNFDVKRGVWVELGAIMTELGFTDATLTQKIQEVYARDVREEDEIVTDVSAEGFLIVGDSANPVTKLLLKVSIQHPGADVWESFFSYTPQGEKLLRLQSECLFDAGEMDKMDPPLWYERRLAYGGIEAEG